jgi:hypothetical protein
LSLFLSMDKLQNLSWPVRLGLRSANNFVIGFSLFLLILLTRLLGKVVFESRHNQVKLDCIARILKSVVILTKAVFYQLKSVLKLFSGDTVVNKNGSHFILVRSIEYGKNVLHNFCFHLICANFT